jgi:chemotaxis methyl-accepting protein methylase
MITFQLGDIGVHPISYLDAVFCRNLLIYYNSNAQDLILNKFYQVIKENKFLILGMEESLLGNKNSKNFIPLFPRERIYQKRSSTDQLSTFISQRNQNKK